jgi:RNA recognition motif-containing protein
MQVSSTMRQPVWSPWNGVEEEEQDLPTMDVRFAESVTTLIIRNIPARYTKERVLEEWIPDGSFNLLHLPYDFGHKRYRGFAFINFCTPPHAMAFARRWHGQKLRYHGNSNPLDVGPAHIQGFEATVRNVQGHLSEKVRGEKYLPSILSGTHRVSFLSVLRERNLEGSQRQPRPIQNHPWNQAMSDQAWDNQGRGYQAWSFGQCSAPSFGNPLGQR